MNESKMTPTATEQMVKTVNAVGSAQPKESLATEDEVEFEFGDGEEEFLDDIAQPDFDMKPSGLDHLAALVGIEEDEDSEN